MNDREFLIKLSDPQITSDELHERFKIATRKSIGDFYDGMEIVNILPKLEIKNYLKNNPIPPETDND